MTKDVNDFFRDVYFDPPNGRPVEDFIGGEAPEQPQQHDATAYGTKLVKPEDVDLEDTVAVSGADPQVWSDYYMFHDPLVRNVQDGNDVLQGPKSEEADKLNVAYKKKDLRATHSVSDVHLETLDQGPAPFPRHAGVRSTMEDSESFDLLDANQPADPLENTGIPSANGNSALLMQRQVVLEKDTRLGGQFLPKGTILIEAMRPHEVLPTADVVQMKYLQYLEDGVPDEVAMELLEDEFGLEVIEQLAMEGYL